MKDDEKRKVIDELKMRFEESSGAKPLLPEEEFLRGLEMEGKEGSTRGGSTKECFVIEGDALDGAQPYYVQNSEGVYVRVNNVGKLPTFIRSLFSEIVMGLNFAIPMDLEEMENGIENGRGYRTGREGMPSLPTEMEKETLEKLAILYSYFAGLNLEAALTQNYVTLQEYYNSVFNLFFARDSRANFLFSLTTALPSPLDVNFFAFYHLYLNRFTSESLKDIVEEHYKKVEAALAPAPFGSSMSFFFNRAEQKWARTSEHTFVYPPYVQVRLRWFVNNKPLIEQSLPSLPSSGLAELDWKRVNLLKVGADLEAIIKTYERIPLTKLLLMTTSDYLEKALLQRDEKGYTALERLALSKGAEHVFLPLKELLYPWPEKLHKMLKIPSMYLSKLRDRSQRYKEGFKLSDYNLKHVLKVKNPRAYRAIFLGEHAHRFRLERRSKMSISE